MSSGKQIMVFGSHKPSPGDNEYLEAVELGRLLAEAGFDVASGGYGGSMEAVLKGSQEGGGKAIGYTASLFNARPNAYVEEEVQSSDLLDRIGRMVAESAGFVVLKGGTGTLCELAFSWEMVNKKMVPYKPIVCLGQFWRNVVETLRVEPSLENVRTLRPEAASAADYVYFASDPAGTVKILLKETGEEI